MRWWWHERVVFFWTNMENFLLLTTDQDSLKIFNFFVKNAYVTLLKNLIKFTWTQELSGPLPKKLKSVKILKTFTHVMRGHFFLYQHTELDFYSASSLKQVRGQTCRSTRTHYSDSEPTSLCYYSLMLHA